MIKSNFLNIAAPLRIKVLLVAMIVAGAVAAPPTSVKATTLAANVTNFAIEPIGAAGSITGIDSTAGVKNYIELQIPSFSIFSITISASNGGTLQFLDSYGNSNGEKPLENGYTQYSTVISSVGSGGSFAPQQNFSWAKLYDPTHIYLGEIFPGYLESSAILTADLTSGTATFTNNQPVGPAVLQIDFAGINTSNSLAPISATFSISATPIPAALPLFASGLGALGLLGWRRKRKVLSGA